MYRMCGGQEPDFSALTILFILSDHSRRSQERVITSPFVRDDCMNAGGRATHGAVADVDAVGSGASLTDC
jgi:hypothetical protein